VAYDESPAAVPLNHSNLFNAMLHPFTCTVIYGTIWYQGKDQDFIRYEISFFDLMTKGEANAAYNTDQYTCSFSKMIENWREIWNEHINGRIDIQFPFGFVQISLALNYQSYIHIYTMEKIYFIHSYQHLETIPQLQDQFHRFAGIKHLMLVMLPIMWFQKYLWLLL
jgi:hypothetical protein